MAGSTISTKIIKTVVLGGGNYSSPLTITATGIVAPSGKGKVGVFSTTSGVLLDNDGKIELCQAPTPSRTAPACARSAISSSPAPSPASLPATRSMSARSQHP